MLLLIVLMELARYVSLHWYNIFKLINCSYHLITLFQITFNLFGLLAWWWVQFWWRLWNWTLLFRLCTWIWWEKVCEIIYNRSIQAHCKMILISLNYILVCSTMFHVSDRCVSSVHRHKCPVSTNKTPMIWHWHIFLYSINSFY